MNTLQRLCALIVPFLILSAPPAAAQPPGALAKDAPAPTCDRSNFRVLVDVGHTNSAGGALSSRGTFEYEFNLRLAGEIEDSLLEACFTARRQPAVCAQTCFYRFITTRYPTASSKSGTTRV